MRERGTFIGLKAFQVKSTAAVSDLRRLPYLSYSKLIYIYILQTCDSELSKNNKRHLNFLAIKGMLYPDFDECH